MITQTPAYRANDHVSGGRDSAAGIQQVMIGIAQTLLLVALWALTHRYNGFARDGELYALQAMARVHPNLAADLYLQNTSQDRFTIFSPIYAGLIGIFGLQSAELLLFTLCTLGFFAAAWTLARELSSRDAAWLAVALLIVTVGSYGAFQVFSYSENYLTARSLGEALVVMALAYHFSGRRRIAMGIALIALFVHPLMVLPGVFLLICLSLTTRQAVIGSAAGIVAVLIAALGASMAPNALPFLDVMDPAWLEVVRERSQFLFLQYWTLTDWELFARPFVCLTLSALVIADARIRKLCIAAMLVGAAGMVVAFIAGSVGPVAILLQGQAWRWVWVTGFLSVLLLVPTALRAYRDPTCGPLCALLLILGWTYSGIDGLAGCEAAVILWLARSYINERAALYLRWAAAALGIVIVVWVIANSWTFASAATAESGRESLLAGRMREIFSLGVPAVVVTGLAWHWIKDVKSTMSAMVTFVALFACVAWILPGSLKQLTTVGTPAEIEEFADWRNAIPPSSSVLLVPTKKSASFPWFTLGRTSYLSVDQSSGVVFSRATAAEVRRRSQVLLPLSDPDWKILTQITEARLHKPPDKASPRPLTAAILRSICADRALNFVVARESVGFEPLRHVHRGGFKDWNLYDCRRVRAAEPHS